MNRNPIVVIIVLVVVIAGGWYVLSKAPAPVTEQAPATADAAATTTAALGVTVAYTDQGFSPASVTVPLGTTVTFVNQSTGNMWVASAMHPEHTVYSGTSVSQHCPDTTGTAFDECRGDVPGGSFSFTFNKEGGWKYHNHVDATKFGTVVVTAP